MTSLAMAAGRPAATQDFWQPRRAAFWALAALLIYGGITIGNLTLEAFREYPVATGIGIPLWVAYAIPLFLLIRWLDLYAQNSGLGMTLAIAYGAFGATALALRANEGLDGIVEKVGGSNLASDWGPALEGPTTEEPLKLLGVILLVMIARTRFRTILPAVFFGALVGLGFQVRGLDLHRECSAQLDG